MAEGEPASQAGLESQFKEWCVKPGQMTTKDMTSMFKQCKIYNKTFTSNDSDIVFCAQRKKMNDAKKAPKPVKEIDFDTFVKVLDEIEKSKKGKKDDMVSKIISTEKTQQKDTVKKGSVTDRLTDSSKYTGAHKERFDKDGKGKGIDGRTDKPDKKGYVSGYQNEGTYGKK